MGGGTKGPTVVVADERSPVHQVDAEFALTSAPSGRMRVPAVIRAGRVVTITGTALMNGTSPPVVRVAGIPVQLLEAGPKRITFRMPTDLWDRPMTKQVDISVSDGRGVGGSGAFARVIWMGHEPRVESIAPNPATVMDRLVITGVHLDGRVLLNGKPVNVLNQTPTHLTVQLPEGIITTTGYNLRILAGEGAKAVRSFPMSVRVTVPNEQLPHLVTAGFSPTRLRVGELLRVTFTVRNNLPTAVNLMTRPTPPFTYQESQSWGDVGVEETSGTIHLRVTSDHPGAHEPGSWPWLFGFSKSRLEPGETVTVEGLIRVATVGQHEFRIGLVATGGRFIDDNAFRTMITVLP
jgi:hypothetical protein